MKTKKEARWQAGEEGYSQSDSIKAAQSIGEWLRDATAWRFALARAYAAQFNGTLSAWIRIVGRAVRGPRGRK